MKVHKRIRVEFYLRPFLVWHWIIFWDFFHLSYLSEKYPSNKTTKNALGDLSAFSIVTTYISFLYKNPRVVPMNWQVPEEFSKKSNKKRVISRDFQDEPVDGIYRNASGILRLCLNFWDLLRDSSIFGDFPEIVIENVNLGFIFLQSIWEGIYKIYLHLHKS
jgi:hypothetical protein